MAGLTDGRVAALAVADRLLQGARRPWWVIAGAAVALHARRPVAVDDIDILLAIEDVPRIADAPGLVRRARDGHALFRSDFYALLVVDSVTIEFMAGFALCCDGIWTPVWPRTRAFVAVGGLSVPVPDRAEMIAMLRDFGRDKDHRRIALLRD